MALDSKALGSSSGIAENNITTISEAVNSLSRAVSVLQSIKDNETNLMFKNLESDFPVNGVDFNNVIRLFEISLIKQALRQTQGHQRNAARLLRLKTSTLNTIIKRYRISY